MKECHKKHDNIQKFEPGALGSTFILKHHSNFPHLSWDSHAYTNLVYVLLSFPITRYNVCDRKKNPKTLLVNFLKFSRITHL